MRVTFGTKYNQMTNSTNSMQEQLNDLNRKIASGVKIQYGYEDSNTLNQELRLGHQEAGLNRNIDVSQNAYYSTLNTDKALSELSKSATTFNTKLIQAANEIHSPTSRMAIANELERIRDHMLNVANTSINGEYIFAGSKTKTKPFDKDGNYNGNDKKLEALVGPDNKIPYNITGKELFFGLDSDYSKSITTNVKKLNLSKLYPQIMDKTNKSEAPKEIYITKDDTLRDLIGDNDDEPSNDKKEYFYLRGIRPDGSHFKSKFEFEKAYSNPQNSAKVSDLLEKIGIEYGNTQNNKVVDVSLNAWGQIEIKSLILGNQNLDFNLISSDVDVQNVEELPKMGARITSFQKSPFLGDFLLDSMSSKTDDFKSYISVIPSTLITKNSQMSSPSTKLSDIFGSEKIQIDGGFVKKIQAQENTQEEQEDVPDVLVIDVAKNNVSDLLGGIEDLFKRNNVNVDAQIINGQIALIDQKAKKEGKQSDIKFTIKTIDGNNNPQNGIKADYRTEYDKIYFQKKGSKLVSNISQNLPNGYAKESTKLSEVSGDMNNQTYTLRLKDHNGTNVEGKIVFNKNGSFLVINTQKKDEQGNTIETKIPMYDLNKRGTNKLTSANEVTYRQLMDTIGIALNYSNVGDDIYKLAQENNGIASFEAYENLLSQTNGRIKIGLNKNAQMEINDTMNSTSKMEFMIFNDKTNDFSEQNIKNSNSGLLFNANNALTIDQPQIDFFGSLDEIIDSVKTGAYRPDALGDAYTQDMRGIGIQNAIAKYEHLSNHIEKMIALNGSYGNSFESATKQGEVVKTQIQSLRGDNIGQDMADAYNKFSNLSTNYNATLASSGKINKMSLLDYI